VINVVKTPQKVLDSVRMTVAIALTAPYPATVTITMPGRAAFALRRSRPRHFLMCPPTYFDVRYAINPWMDPDVPVDRPLAMAQWFALVEAYRAAGHQVDLLDPIPGLPDMVYAANGAFALDGVVLHARFTYAERTPEAAAHIEWHRRNGTGYARPAVAEPTATNEAEGDFAVLADRLLAGYGFRTSRAAHGELAALTGRDVISLELVDPRLYHLDVALTVLDDERDHIAYYPDAFSPDSQRLLAECFPDAILATVTDAYAFGLNCVSDGRNVFVPAGAAGLRTAIAAAGYRPISIDLSELAKGGGSVKCCTQELHALSAVQGGRPHCPLTRSLKETR
jgi:N-dimethylarginine dimethylaminohydrolase